MGIFSLDSGIKKPNIQNYWIVLLRVPNITKAQIYTINVFKLAGNGDFFVIQSHIDVQGILYSRESDNLSGSPK